MTRWPATFEHLLNALPSRSILSKLQAESSNTPFVPATPPRRSGRGAHRAHLFRSPNYCDSYQSARKPQGSRSELRNSPDEPPNTQEPVSGKDFLHFTGSGRDVKPFNCSGILHDLPAQSGTLGWQRVSIIKYGAKDPTTSSPSSYSSSSSATSMAAFSGSSSASSASSMPSNEPRNSASSDVSPFDWKASEDDDIVIDEDCWCYEGIVLPGGKIILGRWWYPLDQDGENVALGPFIFWNVEWQ